MSSERIHLLIHGRVQGVGFRYSAQREAIRLNLVGWVRNRPEGQVETLAAGTKDAIDVFRQWCKEGPTGAKVSHVEELPPLTFSGPTFEILPTSSEMEPK